MAFSTKEYHLVAVKREKKGQEDTLKLPERQLRTRRKVKLAMERKTRVEEEDE